MKYALNGSKVATLIDRNGKDEIRVYNVDESGDSEVVASIILEDIIDFIWASPTTRKKRTPNGGSKESENQNLLVVLLKGSVFVILSESAEINRFKIDDHINKLVKYDDNIWAAAKNSILKISLDGDVKDRIKAPPFNAVSISKKIAFGSTSLQLGKFAKGKFICEDEIEVVEEIRSILQSKSAVVLTEQNNVYIVKKKVEKLASDAHHIQLLHYRDKDYIVAISDSLNFYNDGKLENSISGETALEGVLPVDDSLVVFWSGKNELLFKKIEWSDEEIVIPHDELLMNGTRSHIKVSKPKVYKTDAASLLKKLNDITDHGEIVSLCQSVCDSAVIKEVAKEIGMELFPVISDAVSKDTTNTNLALWFKWIYLIHGKHIAKQDIAPVKEAKCQLELGVKLMSHLIAIQGKLQLLKLQNEMREKNVARDVTTTIDDDNMVYANGEAE